MDINIETTDVVRGQETNGDCAGGSFDDKLIIYKRIKFKFSKRFIILVLYSS